VQQQKQRSDLENLFTALEISMKVEETAKPTKKEEKKWKPSKWNPEKPYYRKASEWLAGTTLDEVPEEEDSEIDLEHLSRGHHL
jgi:hypothetical protein